MKRTCKNTMCRTGPLRPINESPLLTVTSSKNNTRVTISKRGKLFNHTSRGRYSIYTGYEKRLRIAAYANAKEYVKGLEGHFKRFRFNVRIRGASSKTLLALMRSGFKFTQVQEILNPAFNGCRKKSKRRL